MKRILTFILLLLSIHPGVVARTMDLGDMQGWKIVLSPEAIPSEQYAAQEFQSLLEQAVGIRLPIRTQTDNPNHNVFIGHSADMEASLVGFGIDDLGEEGLRIRIHPENIAIAGGRPRGTLYGVYEFMERYLGIRFLTYDHTYIPSKKKWNIPCETWTYIPSFSFRWSYYKENADHPEFAARLRVNTTTRDEKLGGVTKQSLINHSLHYLLPVEKYGKEHPEYFALVDGERKLEMGGGGPELCVTNPEVIEIVAQSVIERLDKNPDQKNFSVSQNDNAAYCRCDNCEAINQREGTPMGSHLAFVNAVAERVEKKYPHVKIGTLAYWYTRKPPKTIRPRHNVQIQLCSIECCTIHPIDDPHCKKNRAFCRDMDTWGQLCDDIWIWNYNTNFRYYDLPFPNLRSISDNIHYFLNHNVHGIFMQANGNGNSGELCDLRNYVISRCLWNPQLDSWKLAKEFCKLHYGKAGKTVMQYLTYLHDNAERAGFHPNCFPQPFEIGLTPEVSGRIWDFFQEALQKAENEVVRNRVEKASICAYRAALETCGSLHLDQGNLTVTYPSKYGDLARRYKELTQKHGQTRAEEWQPIPHYYHLLDQATQKGFPAVSLENPTWRLIVLPENNGRIVEFLHKPSGNHLLMPEGYRSVRNLFDYMTMQEVGLQGYNHQKPAAFQAETENNTLVLTKTLEDGTSIQRTIGLDESAVHFKTTVIHNGPQERAYQFRIQPQVYTGFTRKESDPIDTYVYKDKWISLHSRAHEKEGDALEYVDSPHQGIAFYNRKKHYGFSMRYYSDQVGKPWVRKNERYPMMDIHVPTAPLPLKKNESSTIRYWIEYLDHPPRG